MPFTLQALNSSQATFKSTLADVQSSIAGSSSTYHRDLKKQADSLDAACSDGTYPYGLNDWVLILTIAAVKQLSSVKRARVTATNTLATEAQSGFTGLQNGLASTSRGVQSISAHISKEVLQVLAL